MTAYFFTVALLCAADSVTAVNVQLLPRFGDMIVCDLFPTPRTVFRIEGKS